MLYYKDIADYSHKEYLREVYVKYCGEDVNYSRMNKLNLDYAQEICVNAKIAMKKYKLCNIALLIDIVSIVLAAAAFAYDCFFA